VRLGGIPGDRWAGVEPGHFWRCHYSADELRNLQRVSPDGEGAASRRLLIKTRMLRLVAVSDPAGRPGRGR
jgi:hypothetical protein